MFLARKVGKKTCLMIIIPIALSAYTHLWNASGFPDISYDEGVYLRRAMNVLYYQMLQESETYYDHPYFGQVMLAGLFAITGFPDSVNPTATLSSIETIYLVPKIWMGLFAVLDTFLLYKIVQRRYDSRIAFVAAILFSVMPITWVTRRVLLDSLLLPLILFSILLALNLRTSSGRRAQYLILLLSGATIGLATFTKMPALAAFPLVIHLVLSSSGEHKLKNMMLWLIPAILIPLIWPLHSLAEGQFDFWLDSMLGQTQRTSERIATIFWNFWKIDPALLMLGSAGLAYATFVKREYFPILWVGPFLALFSAVSYVQYFHVIPMIPVFCIASALLLDDASRRALRSGAKIAMNLAVLTLVAFGFTSTTLLITTDMTSSQFEAATFVLWNVKEDTTIVANPAYSWLYNFILHMPFALGDYRDALYSPLPSDNIVLVSEPHFRASAISEPHLELLYNRTSSLKTFHGEIHNYDTSSYPFTSLSTTGQGELIDIRKYPAP